MNRKVLDTWNATPVRIGEKLMSERTDQEVIAEFMEPRPKVESLHPTYRWWRVRTVATLSAYGGATNAVITEPEPIDFTLDALREVEARLTEEQWEYYEAELSDAFIRLHGCTKTRDWVHASVEQKTRALARVLREARDE